MSKARELEKLRGAINQALAIVEDGKFPLFFSCPKKIPGCKSKLVFGKGRTKVEAFNNLDQIPECLHGKRIPPQGARPS